MNLEEATRIELQKLNEQELLTEMSSILTKESGLKTKLNLLYNGAERGLKHWARVKVTLSDGNLFPIEVNRQSEVKPFNNQGQYNKLEYSDKKIIQDAVKYIKSNVDLIMSYWEGKFEEDELHDILQGKISLQDVINNK